MSNTFRSKLMDKPKDRLMPWGGLQVEENNLELVLGPRELEGMVRAG